MLKALFLLACLTSASAATFAGEPTPRVLVDRDNVLITESCQIYIPPGAIIADTDNNGVIQIDADNVSISFAGSTLRGSAANTPPDTLSGVAINVNGRKNITINGAVISGYKIGIRVIDGELIEISDCRFDDNFRNHLLSTPEAENQADWLWPHDNNQQQWATNYGCAIELLRCKVAIVASCTVRRGQNGILLEQCASAMVYDNDCSFLSGWGLALWRTSGSTIDHNAFDFCIRGYSDGVYNRGQDSAGILMFEQCTGNTFSDNSMTHGGDGFFAFTGKGALGQSEPKPAEFQRAGNVANTMYANDCSFAAAHGIETTFSFDSVIVDNLIVGNAICGIWGGYSQDMIISGNTFQLNGYAGYGNERGGINIEHGSNNAIFGNTFASNTCGIRLWSKENKSLSTAPWYIANHKGSVNNIITRNTFTSDTIAFEQQDTTGTTLSENTSNNVEVDIKSDAKSTHDGVRKLPELPRRPSTIGKKPAVGARPELRGRENIIMGPWGPWDHHSPMIRFASRSAKGDVYEVFGIDSPPQVEVLTGQDVTTIAIESPQADQPRGRVFGPPRWLIRVSPNAGVIAYSLRISAGELKEVHSGTIIAASWNVRVFPWTVDPRKDLDGWRAESKAAAARDAVVSVLTLNYANAGPASLKSIPEFKDFAPRDHFGTIASTMLTLPAGQWNLSTLSDDGVRVSVDGELVIDNWTYHGPTRDKGTFTVAGPLDVRIEVEHFEIDGFSTLELSITPGPR